MKKTIKKLSLTIIAYVVTIIISTIVFVLLFHTPILKELDVFFYRGVVLLFIASLFSFCIMLVAKKYLKKLELDIKDAFVVFFLFAGFTLGWFTLLPVTVERSVSVFMLSYMDQNDDAGITSDEFGDIFYDKYITDFGAFDKRFKEQLLSGNMEEAKDGEGYVITDSGRFVVNMFRFCAELFGTEEWLVYPNNY